MTEISLGKLYAAQISSDWHRVKVISGSHTSQSFIIRMFAVKVLSRAGDSCTCFFIDHGDEDSVPVSSDYSGHSQNFL